MGLEEATKGRVIHRPRKPPSRLRLTGLTNGHCFWRNSTAAWVAARLVAHSACTIALGFCSHCLLDEVKKWREEMSHVVSEVQDLELRWIFKPDPDSATITPRQALARPSRGTGDGQGSTTSTSEVDDAGQSTSTSNPADSDSDSGHEEKVAKQTSRHYSVRQGSKRPSVRIGLFLHGADKGMRICQKAAVWALCISKARLHRATRQH